MGVKSLCNEVAIAMKNESNQGGVKHGQISGNVVLVAGQSYRYAAAVDISFDNGDWVYVLITNNLAVVVGK